MLRIGYAQSDGRVGPLGHMTPPPGANDSPSVMAGLVPAIHVFLASGTKDVDARHEAGHDGSCRRNDYPKLRSQYFVGSFSCFGGRP
jgi:hypothetical protein